MLTIGADLALSPVYVSKAAFSLVLDCVVFPLAALIPDAMGRSVWSPHLGMATGAQCSARHWATSKCMEVLEKIKWWSQVSRFMECSTVHLQLPENKLLLTVNTGLRLLKTKPEV